MSAYTNTDNATITFVCKPRFKSVATLFSIISMLLTMIPAIGPAGDEAWENALRVYNLAGFSIVGIVYMVTPLLLLLVYRQALPIEAKILRCFLIFIAGITSYAICLKEAFVWFMETTGEMPVIEGLSGFLLIVWCYELGLILSDTWRSHQNQQRR